MKQINWNCIQKIAMRSRRDLRDPTPKSLHTKYERNGTAAMQQVRENGECEEPGRLT